MGAGDSTGRGSQMKPGDLCRLRTKYMWSTPHYSGESIILDSTKFVTVIAIESLPRPATGTWCFIIADKGRLCWTQLDNLMSI